ncbi:flagellar protein FlaG [Desulfuromusa kysingii]|uniref:Flagellar protein FlaG n=1 Tax=Desulfuromusa kysingii TaxID=37625 RepID=A0A1H3VMQ7_9BACT|nr:flagellar protein FlaG [Desulfuromusa kysingii]SDZ76039.1 flagellar protein FlaG [Desulfuromusa kysingii]
MIVDATSLTGSAQTQLSKGAEQVKDGRNKAADLVQSEAVEKNQVQPEELLSQIKALAEEGLYSVRFENDERNDELVVKIVDRESDEVIRQVPAEEILDLKESLASLRGNLVNTAG